MFQTDFVNCMIGPLFFCSAPRQKSRDFKADWFLHRSEDEPNIRTRDCEEEEEEDNNNEEETEEGEKKTTWKRDKEKTLDFLELQISC